MPINKLKERRINAELLKMGPKTARNSDSTVVHNFENSVEAAQKNYNKANQ
jgi:hypothetical protein